MPKLLFVRYSLDFDQFKWNDDKTLSRAGSAASRDREILVHLLLPSERHEALAPEVVRGAVQDVRRGAPYRLQFGRNIQLRRTLRGLHEEWGNEPAVQPAEAETRRRLGVRTEHVGERGGRRTYPSSLMMVWKAPTTPCLLFPVSSCIRVLT